MNKFLAIAAAAVLTVSGMALASELPQTGQVNNQTAAVPVKIVVPSIVSVWADYSTVTLTVGQSDGNGFAGQTSSLSYINNVPATIMAKVDGALENTTTGMNFFIFNSNITVSQAQAACMVNAATPAGALAWNNAAMGTSQKFADVATNMVGGSLPLVYAADIPNGVAAPSSYDLVVTYTIAPAAQ